LREREEVPAPRTPTLPLKSATKTRPQLAATSPPVAVPYKSVCFDPRSVDIEPPGGVAETPDASHLRVRRLVRFFRLDNSTVGGPPRTRKGRYSSSSVVGSRPKILSDMRKIAAPQGGG